MSKKPTDSSGISFTALYTGAVWHRFGLSDDALTTRQGDLLYHLMTPFEVASKAIVGGNIRTFLLQRHLIIDELIERAVTERGITRVLEVACGMSPRGIRLRQRHPHLHMVEADLPGMASRKAAHLLAAGRLGPHHQVIPVDILAETGDNSLEAVIGRAFPGPEPVIVVTEGLTSYFSLAVIAHFWQRLAGALAARPGSVYLTESYLMPRQPLLRGSLRTLGGMLGKLTRSQVSFHFHDDGEARQTFLRAGFEDVRIHNPETFYDRLAIPRSRQAPMIRIIEAGQPD